MAEEVDCYDVHNGWTKVPDPLRGQNPEPALEAMEAETYLKFGTEMVGQVTVYRGQDGGFIVLFDSLNSWETIVAPNLPSMIELVSKLSQIIVGPAVNGLQASIDLLQDTLKVRS